MENQTQPPSAPTTISENQPPSPEPVYPEQGRRVKGYGKKNWKKWILIISAIILLLIFVVPLFVIGFYTYRFNQDKKIIEEKDKLQQQSQVQDETVYTEATESANWKTYKKDNLWEIQYPSNWYIPETFNPNIVGFSDGKDVPRGPNAEYIYVQVIYPTNRSDFNDYFVSEDKVLGVKQNILKTEKLTIDDHPAVKITRETAPGEPTEYAYIIDTHIKGPVNVTISALALKGPTKEFIDIYLPSLNQMLSTFRFTQ